MGGVGRRGWIMVKEEKGKEDQEEKEPSDRTVVRTLETQIER